MNNNVLSGTNVMPAKGQSSSGGGAFSLMRSVYQNTPKPTPKTRPKSGGKMPSTKTIRCI